MPYADVEAKKESNRRYYVANRQAAIERAGRHNKAQSLRIRELISSSKNKPCADCGGRYPPYVMDFDHVRGEKLFTIGHIGRVGLSLKRVQEEIAKCDVVCANCHRERTHGGSAVGV